MGLLDRHKTFLEEQAQLKAAKAGTDRKDTIDSKRAISESERSAKVEAAKLRSVILPELTPLLEALDIKRQLEDLRILWKTGKVDNKPFVGERPYSFAGFDYTYKHWDLGVRNEKFDHGEFYGTRQIPYPTERTHHFAILVRKVPTTAFRVLWDESEYTFKQGELWNSNPLLWYTFEPEGSSKAKQTLEAMMHNMYLSSKSPKEIKTAARKSMERKIVLPFWANFQGRF